ncbi:MAG: WGxxGxxG family protein [Leptolyngbyaceae cyanobacterium bins.302]|nr:WGxxGxxG family protein [Leptolyngbyaceae cyanobacterium bins.302]
MKWFNPFYVASVGFLVTGITIASIAPSAIAQTNPAPGSSPSENVQQNNAPNVDTTPFQETEGKTDNYGWLGLFGLLGLLNLLRKPEEHRVYREPDVTASQTRDRL